ncbi:MAG: ABC transporter ATP-binding protein [Pseudomonadota bacterium]
MNAAACPLEALRVEGRLGGRTVVQPLSLALRPGEWLAIVGPNGAGKSTLLKLLSGLLAPSGGELRLQGRALHHWPVRERAQRIAWLAQQADTAPELTVRDVVRLGRLPHLGLLGTPGPRDEAIVEQAMALTECREWAERPLDRLSGGERQRALLARALAVQAPVLLLDEPTTHLDPPHQVALVRLLQRLARRDGLAVASVLHDLSLALHADRLAVMAGGRLRACGPCDDAAVREELAEVFHHAVRIERLGDAWVAVPRLQATAEDA